MITPSLSFPYSDISTSEWLSEWRNEWVSEWMSEWMNEWRNEWVNNLASCILKVENGASIWNEFCQMHST